MEKPAKTTDRPNRSRIRSLNFSIGLVLSLTMVITAFEWNFKSPLTHNPLDDINPTEVSVKPEMVAINPPPPPKPKIENPTEIIETKKPIVKPDKKDIEIPTIDPSPGFNGEPDLTDIFTGGHPEGKETVYRPNYEMIPAVPVGGLEAFYEYLYSQIRYPQGLSKSGTVQVKFLVSTTGKITEVEIVEGFDKSLEKEIVRVLKNAPEWIPAQIGAKRVSMWHKIPFSFNLQ